MRGLTDKEIYKINEITNRLSEISSPVIRVQAIITFSQLVDILSIGDTSSEREIELIRENDELRLKLDEYEIKQK